jgi:hypothetical protein
MMECEGEASEGEVVEVAEAGICGMIEAHNDKGDGFSSDVMINAAMHTLSAWVASSQAPSTSAEREADLNDLLEPLPSCIEYHRAARWLPKPHRADHRLTVKCHCHPSVLRGVGHNHAMLGASVTNEKRGLLPVCGSLFGSHPRRLRGFEEGCSGNRKATATPLHVQL